MKIKNTFIIPDEGRSSSKRRKKLMDKKVRYINNSFHFPIKRKNLLFNKQLFVIKNHVNQYIALYLNYALYSLCVFI